MRFPKLPKITAHDAETGAIAFGAGFLASLSQSGSFSQAALVAALAGGLTAVAHKFLKGAQSTENPPAAGDASDPNPKG